MTDLVNIVPTLIAQHRTLEDDLGQANAGIDNEVKIDESLKKFTQDLHEHLTLENDVFYVELLKKMKDRGQDTTQTEVFIDEMEKIAQTITAFLEKFNSAENIKEKISEFKVEFGNIIEALKMRIEAEEAGVYLYWE